MKVVGATSGEAIQFGAVEIYQHGVLMSIKETDLDGDYYFNSIDPGTNENP